MALASSSDLVLVDLTDWKNSTLDNVSEFRSRTSYTSSNLGESIEFIDSDEFSSGDSETASQQATMSSGNSASITSVVNHETLFNGRSYCTHSMNRYPLPSDDMERDREDLKHFMLVEMTEGKHFLAPIEANPRRILDLGTGTGMWAVEVGDLFPNTSVTGVDIRPIQPQWSPPNVNFYIDDFEEDWLNGGDFDLIHARHVLPFIKKPAELLQRSFENVKPGGWIEVQELDHMAHYGNGSRCNSQEYPIARYLDHASTIWAELGTDLRVAPNIDDLLRQAGFINIKCTIYRIPIGAWSKLPKFRSLGTYLGMVLQMVIPAMYHNPTVAPKWDDADLDAFVDECKASLQDLSVHAFMRCFFWQGQKPFG